MPGSKTRLGRGIEALLGGPPSRTARGGLAVGNSRLEQDAWEYAWIERGRKRVRLTVAADGARKRPSLPADDFALALVGMGRQGWELVAVQGPWFYFKRIVRAEAREDRVASDEAGTEK